MRSMASEIFSSLCRICLVSGATNLIFMEIKEENSVHSKLCECLKEKVEDIEGYPRYICEACIETLDIVYEFINKFKDSHRLLNDELVNLKEEGDSKHACSDFELDHLADIKIELNSIKTEQKSLDTLKETREFIDFLQPLKDKHSKISIKRSIKSEKAHFETKKLDNRTSKVATSILEGEFVWTGETWSLKSTHLKRPKIKIEDKPKRRNTRLMLPRKPTVKQPKLCDICGDTFKTQYKLSTHRKKVHFSMPTQCTQCTRICSSEKNLLHHMKRKHNENKEFVCAVCGNCFAFKGELTNHINKVHKGKPKKTFKCKFCAKNYNSQKSVIIHERSAHTGERPAECTVCYKCFFHEEYLKEHMRLHTGEAPYKCPVCGRGYAQRGNMKSHLRIHRITEIDAVTLSKIKPNYLKLLKV